ncbi:DUF1093 domain-containing protein [Bacillus luti]|uniref:DUF1093 domain-containing protein n=1 Tax=Bacillus luti TaxID=2026191 RepID=UPI0012E95060|nr:DUF1093 domain-containing protein [Bacillus luti]
MLFILCTTLLQHCKDVVIYFNFSHFIIALYCVKKPIEGDTEKVEDRNLRNFTLPAYDEDGVKKQITFRSTKKENDHKLNENAFLRLYVDQDDDNKKEISSIEVKSYEEIQKSDLPTKVQEKFNIK